MRSARPASFSSWHNVAFTAPSIGTFVNNDSTSFLFEKKFILLIVTLTGTHVGSKRLSI